MRGIWRSLLAVLLVAGLAAAAAWRFGAGDGAGPPRTAAGVPDRLSPDLRAEAVALQSLRARQRDPDAVLFREVRVWRFGPEDERAVCGVVEARDLPGGSAPFVVRVLLPSAVGGGAPAGRPQPGAAAAGAMPVLEDGPGLGRPEPEARRRFCRDAAGPEPTPPPAASTPLASVPPTSALAGEGASVPAAAPAVPEPEPGAAAAGAATGETVTVLSHANLRQGPLGGEPVLSVIPRGTVLSVFGRAPGGWVRVGEGEPWGWIHGSMLAEGAVAGGR